MAWQLFDIRRSSHYRPIDEESRDILSKPGWNDRLGLKALGLKDRKTRYGARGRQLVPQLGSSNTLDPCVYWCWQPFSSLSKAHPRLPFCLPSDWHKAFMSIPFGIAFRGTGGAFVCVWLLLYLRGYLIGEFEKRLIIRHKKTLR